jgi:ubiquinone biosynthesis protein UbiJ
LAEPDLNFVVRQLERLTAEVAGMRDELRVQGAMIRRLDVGQSVMLEELRAIRDQVARMNDRIHKLEDAT